MKKKPALIILGLVILFVLSGCIYTPGPGKRPTDYEPAFWVSDSPDIWFEVLKFEEGQDYQAWGQVIVDDKTTEFIVFFSYSDAVHFYDIKSPSVEYIFGRCTFYEDKLVIKVDPDKDMLFGGKVSVLTFYRTNVDPK